MFLYPALLYIFRGIPLRTTYLANIGGVTLEDAYRMIGTKAKFRPSLFANLVLPRILSGLFGRIKVLDQQAGKLTKNIAYNRQIQLSVINRLERLVSSLRERRYSSHWTAYDRTNSYEITAEKMKMAFVSNALERIGSRRLLDIGCNTGTYSRMAAAKGADVIAIDSDHDCIDKLYNDGRDSGIHITPLCVDISSPSPAIGWKNTERKSFLERAEFDCVLSLALVHHLLVSGRHPLPNVVELMSQLTDKYLITEFIGRDDAMFKTLMLNRKENYEFFDLEYFKNAHTEKFKILEEAPLPNMDRRLFLMEKTG
jgi:cyclopropane fatty-acyl-phospholipid synthase-like methyltransferase